MTHRVRPHLLILTPLHALRHDRPGLPDRAGPGWASGRCRTDQRTVPSQIWLAALARDPGRLADGCDQPPERCEAHHIVPFADGGSTSLSNTALLCLGANGHHHQLHDQQRPVRTRHGRLLGPHGYLDTDDRHPDDRDPDDRDPDDGDPDDGDPGDRDTDRPP